MSASRLPLVAAIDPPGARPARRAGAPRLVRAIVLLACTANAFAGSRDEPGAPPAAVEVEVDTADAALTGLIAIRLAFAPYEDFDRSWGIRVEITDGARTLATLDHAPEPPTRQWRKDRTVAYVLPCALPFDALAKAGREVDVRVGFLDPASGKAHGPGESSPLPGPLPSFAAFEIPRVEPVESDERVAALLAAARERKTKGVPADAWSILELGIRAAGEDSFKYTLRDELLALGHFAPRPLSAIEKGIVAGRIAEERERYLRLISGRMYDRGRYHGALSILAEIGGRLSERADQAVLGALSDAERAQKDLDGVKQALFESLPEAEREEVRAAIEELGASEALFEKAETWRKKKRYAAARRALRAVISGESSNALMERARAAIEGLEAEWLAAAPEDELAEARAAIEHPSFARTVAVPSHRFVFIGPKTVVESLPPDSVRRFDLAYVFLTDLFGRVPNPEGDRVTVYFKELWDFGGGVGGGKIIDIGSVDPNQKGRGVDNGLLYHELTHCIDDTIPIFAGFREGLANFGAAYAFEALDQKEDVLHSFRGNLEAFEKEYLARDLEYWRIQNYGPSAGFFLSFVARHAKTASGHDWKPYRKFFREYRAAPVRDGREPYVARALAHYLVRAFGPLAFDDLVAYRFPLVEADRATIGGEIFAFEDDGSLDPFAGSEAFAEFPGSPLPRDVRTAELLRLAGQGSRDEARRYAESELGVIFDWRVAGPFPSPGADPLCCPFPPERTIDYSARYPTKHNLVQWAAPQEARPLTLRPTGWVEIEYPYQDDTAIYATTTITAPQAIAAFAHLRVDDDFALFVNGRRIGSYLDRGDNGSTRLDWRGPRREVPDAVRLPIELVAGANVVLLKIKNRSGLAGFAFAISRRDGSPIPGLTASAATAPGDSIPDHAAKTWRKVFGHSFRNRSFAGKLDVAVGSFKVREGALVGEATNRGVEWRKYTVRPGFPKDSPSNLAWLSKEATKGVTDFELVVDFADARPPKIVITFQGEGGKDGLSGWNLILEPHGEGVRASLERYDRLVLQTMPVAATGKRPERLVLTWLDGFCSARLGDTVLFDRAPLRPISPASGEPRERIGFATWGSEARIAAIELSR